MDLMKKKITLTGFELISALTGFHCMALEASGHKVGPILQDAICAYGAQKLPEIFETLEEEQKKQSF